MKKLFMAAALIATFTGTGLAQDVEKGANVFKQCQPCHSLGPGAQNKIGPELNGLDGRTAGTVPSFMYSEPNKKSGIVWNEKVLRNTSKIPGQKSLAPK